MKIAVVGFGMMGRQLAQVFAQSGYEVSPTDDNPEALKLGLEDIADGPYGIRSAVSKGKISSEEANKALERIHPASTLEDACTSADLVIEAVFESLELKQTIFAKVESVAPPTTLLASNTSTIGIAKIASRVKRKERALGMHFFNPVQVTKLVEIVRTPATSSQVVEMASKIVQRLGKTPIIVRDEPGFVANRLGLSLYIEASRLHEDGIAEIRDIDAAMKLGYNHSMGPFELADFVGLDTRIRNLEALFQSTGDEKWIPPKALRQMVNQGYLGDPSRRKNSKGGYYQFFGLAR